MGGRRRRSADPPRNALPEPESDRVIDFGVQPARDFAPERAQQANVYEAVAEHVADLRRGGHKVVLASYTRGARERLGGLLEDHGLKAQKLVDNWQEALGVKSQPALLVLPLDHGFTTPDVAVLTEQDMLGDRLVRRRKKRKAAAAFLEELATLSPGDLVVHADHGIGRYEGLTQIPVSKVPHDCVAIEYARGNKLYVPVENIELLSRYGSESEGVTLDSLGGEAWQRRKARMKERIREIAGELIKRRRAARHPTRRHRRAGRQLPAIRRPLPVRGNRRPGPRDRRRARDLEAGRPMDRLVCGDVGFGKTEVALRAAFVMAMTGRQVALICPTTLLARQHYKNFVERLHGFPLNVGRLSRLVPAAEAKKTKEGLADGTIDIVIGTHALLAKSIEFKRLGLVIVDEEQHFGVAHKERLKALKADVHVLTLTATPIPRTLQMAMSGLRELSVIQTPPVDRLAVRTYVTPWDGGGPSRGVAARTFPRRAELLRRTAHRRPARHRRMDPRAGARGEIHHCAWPDEPDRGRGADERLLRPEIRRATVDDDCRERSRHPQRQHADRLSLRPLRPRPTLPAPRPRRVARRPALTLI